MVNRNHVAVNTLKTLGFPLSNIRKALHKLTGISQYELAERLGVSRVTITGTVAGTRGSAEVQAGIAGVYEVPVDVLFDGKPEQTSEVA